MHDTVGIVRGVHEAGPEIEVVGSGSRAYACRDSCINNVRARIGNSTASQPVGPLMLMLEAKSVPKFVNSSFNVAKTRTNTLVEVKTQSCWIGQIVSWGRVASVDGVY